MAEGVLTAYRAVLRSRIRSQTTYRGSFALDLASQGALGLLELAEVLILFSNVTVLGDLTTREALLVFGLANLGFALGDMLAGHLDRLPTYLRAGTLDAFLLRPRSVLAQLVTADLALKRLGRTAVGIAVLAYALPTAVERWTPAKVLLVALTPLTGAAVFAALFVCAAALQFWLVDGTELASAFTYGGSYASQHPARVFPLALRAFFAFVVPAAFVGYLPALVLLDRSGPALLPAWLGWCGPVAAIATWAVALVGWRAGLRRYTGAGG